MKMCNTLASRSIRRYPSLAKLLVSGLIALSLSACGGGDFSDLQTYVDRIKTRKSQRIEPLPEIKPYETYIYQSSGKRDPFTKTFVAEEPAQQAQAADGIRPDFNRRKEALEDFPLDTLRMVGSLEQAEDVWAIVSAGDGTIHRVQKGNYMGQNHGRIIRIAEEGVELVEIIPNGLGGWQERPASLPLVEPL